MNYCNLEESLNLFERLASARDPSLIAQDDNTYTHFTPICSFLGARKSGLDEYILNEPPRSRELRGIYTRLMLVCNPSGCQSSLEGYILEQIYLRVV